MLNAVDPDSLVFASIDGLYLVLRPTLFSEVRIHEMSIQLSDGNSISGPYPFTITVVNEPPKFVKFLPKDEIVNLNN